MNRVLATVVGIALCAASASAARADQTQDAVNGFAVQEYTATFYAGQDSRVVMQSIGGTYLIVEVYDAGGNLVGRATDKTATAVVAWIPLWTDKYSIRVINPASWATTYVLATK
jgi:opacity protein-like surface antigen